LVLVKEQDLVVVREPDLVLVLVLQLGNYSGIGWVPKLERRLVYKKECSKA
jgi:hypothetical protein